MNTTPVTGGLYLDTTAPAGAHVVLPGHRGRLSGNESVRSASAQRVPAGHHRAGQLPGITATGSATGITVAWTASEATDLAGYNVYRSATAGGSTPS